MNEPTENKYDSNDNPPQEPPKMYGIDNRSMQQRLDDAVPPQDWDSIQYWQKAIMAWAESKGWNQNLDERSFGDWTSLLYSEIAEAYEDHRDHREPNEVYYEIYNSNKELVLKTDRNTIFNPRDYLERGYTIKPCGIPIEIADLCIRAFHFAEFFNFDLTQMIADKMAYNEKRPFRHGNKRL